MDMHRRFNRLELDEQQVPVQQQELGALSQHHDQHDAPYWMRSADANRRNGRHESALRDYSRALELDRTLVIGWVGQVQMLVFLDEYPEAELWARKALELFRNHAGLLAGRAQAMCRKKDLKQAQALSDASLAQQGQTAYCWMVRGEIMLARRESTDGYCLSKAVQIDGDWLVNLEIASILLHYDQPAKAITHCRQALEKAPDQAQCWYMQAKVEARLSLNRAARASYLRCLELSPNHEAARSELAELSSSSGFFSRLFGR
jgi:tetratricopeptide (TPR) repeat protein